MVKYFFLLILILTIAEAKAVNKKEIISNLKIISNLSFDFEQNINGKIENGRCTLKYPKKIYCKYNLSNNKILVSNGRSVIIKTDIGSYYRYSLKSTPLNLILDKNYLLNEIKNLNENNTKNGFITYSINKDKLKIDIFFDKKTFNLKGWQTLDIYQNISVTNISNLIINQEIDVDQFTLPKPN